MDRASRKARWMTTIAVAVIAPFVFAPAANAQSCQSATQVAADLWDEYGKTARQLGCAGVTAGTVVATAGVSLPGAVTQYQSCMAKSGLVEKATDAMIKAWNDMANNNWATIGPGRLEMNTNQIGTIRGPGTRVWVTESPMTHNTLDLSIEKIRYRGKTEVTVCTHLPDGSENVVWNFHMAPGLDNKGKVWNKEISDVAGRIVSVFLKGDPKIPGVSVKSMQYRLRAEPKHRLEYRAPERAGAVERDGVAGRDAGQGAPSHVVIAGPPSHRGDHPGVVRVRDVGNGDFQLRFQEWDYRERDHGDTAHKYERIPYIVLEPGRHQMPDGSVWEVGTFRLDGTKNWEGQSFDSSFPDRPKLFLTIQTYNGSQAVNVRARNVDRTGFQAAFFEEEALNDGHKEEVVAYLAVHSPRGSGEVLVDGFRVPYELKTVKVDDSGTDVAGVRLFVEEEKSDDDETGHKRETVDVLDIGGKVLAQDVSTEGGDSAALRQEGGDPGTGIIKSGRATADDGWRTFPMPPS